MMESATSATGPMSPSSSPSPGLIGEPFMMSTHSRSVSMTGFEETSFSVAAASMQAELNKLADSYPEGPDKARFILEMDAFFALFTRFLIEKSSRTTALNWDKVHSPSQEQILPYKSLSQAPGGPAGGPSNLSKLAVLKLNGGLGTTMGCVGPKSAIEVRDGMTFLDLTVRQIEYLNSTNDVAVPLILMNSFNTNDETSKIIQKYKGHQLEILTFNQSRFPRIGKETLLPTCSDYIGKPGDWFPPGHGDLFESLANSGTLDKLLDDGKEYLFVSNVDNLGATVDVNILNHFAESKSEFIMEVTDKTKADIKGGTLIQYGDGIRLLEIAQVPPEYLDEFKSIKKFKIFNTNNLWINLKAIKRVIDQNTLSLEIIVNGKTLDSGEKVIQLETAVGAAIKHFHKAHGINVPRSRFLPVKSCSDLFLIKSDLYKVNHGELVMNPKRVFGNSPLVKLGDHFKKVNHFLSRFAGPPRILELDHLTVTGDVTFGVDVTLMGTVIIVANHGARIDIPAGAVLNDKVVSGNLRILDH